MEIQTIVLTRMLVTKGPWQAVDGYKAHLLSEPGWWGCGTSIDEAIGSLMRTIQHEGLVNLRIDTTAIQPEETA